MQRLGGALLHHGDLLRLDEASCVEVDDVCAGGEPRRVPLNLVSPLINRAVHDTRDFAAEQVEDPERDVGCLGEVEPERGRTLERVRVARREGVLRRDRRSGLGRFFAIATRVS